MLGSLLVLATAGLLARLVDPAFLDGVVQRGRRALERPSGPGFALALGGLAFVLSATVAALLFQRQPTSVDEMIQLLHAQVVLGGRVSLPLPGPAAAWSVQNGLVTPSGWASIFPPGHTVALALGLGGGVPWLVGPLGVGTAVALATGLGAPRLRSMALWAVALSLAGSAFLAPGAALAYRADDAGAVRLPSPELQPAVVFVHGSWASRVAARLTQAGMRRDSVETALRRNDLCAASEYASWHLGSVSGPSPGIDLSPAPGTPSGLATRLLSPGNPIRVDPERSPTSACRREADADRLGTVELEPLLWRAPPSDDARVLLARDLGPLEDRAVLDAHQLRRPYVYAGPGAGAAPRLLPYHEGMHLLWRGAAGVTADGR